MSSIFISENQVTFFLLTVRPIIYHVTISFGCESKIIYLLQSQLLENSKSARGKDNPEHITSVLENKRNISLYFALYKLPLHAGTAMILGQKSLLPEFLCNLWNFHPDASSTLVNAPIVRSPALRPPNTFI